MKYLVILGLLVSFAFATVDINTATKEELVSLKKIGPKKAEKILAYRKTNCFKNIKALKKVKGIKKKQVKKILKKNKGNITASECKAK